MIPWLSPETPRFPPADTALQEPNGLLAAGGNLSTETLLNAYQNGIFPWFNEGEPILWWSPDPRLVLVPAELHVSRKLRKTLRTQSKHWHLSINQAFAAVMQACMQPTPERPDTWITPTMYQAYQQLHTAGFAHSIEVFDETKTLIGGLYGIAIGRMFFGESMFSRHRDASKVALFHLCQHLRKHQFPLIDCQIQSKHLTSLGAKPIPRKAFLQEIGRLCEGEPKTSNVWETQSLGGDSHYIE